MRLKALTASSCRQLREFVGQSLQREPQVFNARLLTTCELELDREVFHRLLVERCQHCTSDSAHERPHLVLRLERASDNCAIANVCFLHIRLQLTQEYLVAIRVQAARRISQGAQGSRRRSTNKIGDDLLVNFQHGFSLVAKFKSSWTSHGECVLEVCARVLSGVLQCIRVQSVGRCRVTSFVFSSDAPKHPPLSKKIVCWTAVP